MIRLDCQLGVTALFSPSMVQLAGEVDNRHKTHIQSNVSNIIVVFNNTLVHLIRQS